MTDSSSSERVPLRRDIPELLIHSAPLISVAAPLSRSPSTFVHIDILEFTSPARPPPRRRTRKPKRANYPTHLYNHSIRNRNRHSSDDDESPSNGKISLSQSRLASIIPLRSARQQIRESERISDQLAELERSQHRISRKTRRIADEASTKRGSPAGSTVDWVPGTEYRTPDYQWD
jgi:hypothetical protein